MEQMDKESKMKRILISIICAQIFICANAINRPSIQLLYKQTIQGNGTEWRVEGIFHPYADIEDGDLLEVGDVELTFIDIHDKDHKMVYTGTHFSDSGIYLKHTYQKGEAIYLNLIPKPSDEMLSYDSAFFFSDLDFDGEAELVITQWRGGSKSSNRYVAYDLDESKQMKCKPFADGIEDEFYEWNSTDKEVKVIDVLDGTSVYHCSIYSLKGGIPVLMKIESSCVR